MNNLNKDFLIGKLIQKDNNNTTNIISENGNKILKKYIRLYRYKSITDPEKKLNIIEDTDDIKDILDFVLKNTNSNSAVDMKIFVSGKQAIDKNKLLWINTGNLLKTYLNILINNTYISISTAMEEYIFNFILQDNELYLPNKYTYDTEDREAFNLYNPTIQDVVKHQDNPNDIMVYLLFIINIY